jgi:archaellum biogenesis protein FlaJ (TadC family)
MRETVLVIMIILFIIGYFKVCYAIDDKKYSRIYYVFLMVVLFGFSIALNFSLIVQQDDYKKEIKELKKWITSI